MAPASLPPIPGNMTVPPLFGWGDILAVLTLVVVVAVAFFVAAALGADRNGRSEWQSWLDERSSRRQYPALDPGDRSEPALPGRPVPSSRTGNDGPRPAYPPSAT